VNPDLCFASFLHVFGSSPYRPISAPFRFLGFPPHLPAATLFSNDLVQVFLHLSWTGANLWPVFGFLSLFPPLPLSAYNYWFFPLQSVGIVEYSSFSFSFLLQARENIFFLLIALYRYHFLGPSFSPRAIPPSSFLSWSRPPYRARIKQISRSTK